MPILLHSVVFAAWATLGKITRAVANNKVAAGIVKRSWGDMDQLSLG